MGTLLPQLMTWICLVGTGPPRVVDWPLLFLKVGGGGRMELRVGNQAPWGRPFSGNPVDSAVLGELIQRGQGTPAEIVLRLKETNQFFTQMQVEAAMTRWADKGWITFTKGSAHITEALIEYLK